MKRFAKTALTIFIALFVCAGNVYAINSNARIKLNGTFATETKNRDADAKYDFFKLGSAAQKDSDGIEFELSGENFGGRIGLWYTVDSGTGSERGSDVSFRRSGLWFVPFASTKISVGYVGNDQLFKERIDGWKVGNPFALKERNWSLHPGYINCSDVDDMGFGIELKPVDGLVVTAAMARRAGAPGSFGKAFWTLENGESAFDAWGVTGRYYFNDLCFQLGYRDNGSEQWKVARAAIGYEGNGFYGFFQPCFGIDWNATEEKYNLSGICFDLYGEYKIGSWGFMAHVPVTLRLTNKEDDPSFMEYSFLVKYNIGSVENMGDITASLRFGSLVQDGDNQYASYRLNNQFTDSANFCVSPGIGFNVGLCSFNTSFNLIVNSKLSQEANNKEAVEWNIPFSAVLKF